MDGMRPVGLPRASFSALLRHYRTAAGLTQEGLAEQAGLSVRNLRDLERGAPQRPQRATLERLATALGLPADAYSAFVAAAQGIGRPAYVPAAVPPFAGRVQELALLDWLLTGQGPPLLVLAGEPGIGKSRLLQAAVARAVGYGLRVLAGSCRGRGGQTAYTPLLEALQTYLRELRVGELRAALQGCAWLVRLLPELADGPIEPLPAWVLPAAQERRLMIEAVRQVLTNVSGPGGIVLLLDDLQWAAPDALDLLAALARSTFSPALRIVAAYRDTEPSGEDPLFGMLGDLAQAGLVTQHRLDPLARDEAAWLLERIVPPSLPTMHAHVLERAGGVPFFLVSWAQMLQDNAEGGGAAPVGVPWTVAQGVRQRIAALPQAVRDVVGAAAVVGRKIPRVLLAQVAGQSDLELIEALEAVCRMRLLEEDGVHGYRFAHDVIREVVETSLSTARRTLLHQRIAEVLAAGPGKPPVEEIAYHYARTEDHEAAVLWLDRAGDQAIESLAHTAALEFYRTAVERALAGGAAPVVLSRLHEKLGELYLLRLELSQAQQLFTQARLQVTDVVHRAGLWRKEGIVQSKLGDLHAALAAFNAAENQAGGGAALPPMVRAAICADRAFTLYVLGDFAASEADVERAFALLRDEIPTPAIDRLLAPAAWIQVGVCDIRGDVAGAHAGALRLLTLAERIGDQQYIGRAVFGLGVCAWRETRLAEAEAHVHSAQPLVDRAGDTEYIMGCAWLLGCVFVSRGEFDAAEAHFLQALEISKKARHLYFLGLFNEELGKVAGGKGDLQSAENWFRQSLSIREQLGDQRGIAQSWNGLAMVARERGDLTSAARWYRRARRLAHRQQAFIAEADAVTGQIRVGLMAADRQSLAQSRHRTVAALLAHGQTLVANHTMPEASLQLALLKAELLARRNQPNEGHAIAAEVLQVSAAAGLRPLEEQARRLLGSGPYRHDDA
jgi:tetratricopeptide (TPR) repeat protein/transcriptional regulator with XRE-family HTH domain